MTRILAILTATFTATTTFAGEVSMSSAAHLPEEQAMMGSENTWWIVPLAFIALIALTASSQNDDDDEGPRPRNPD